MTNHDQEPRCQGCEHYTRELIPYWKNYCGAVKAHWFTWYEPELGAMDSFCPLLPATKKESDDD